MATRLSLAAANNAAWCDVVCRSHGVPTSIDELAWTARTRTPALYPDAVSLVPDPSVQQVLARIDDSSGASIKDSFASLDLHALGWTVLFHAQWIARPPTATAGRASTRLRWEQVVDADAFADWERAWRGDDAATGVLLPSLLDDDTVVVLAGRDAERLVGGAIFNRTGDVVGLSNLFGDATGCVARACELFPSSTLVGYDRGEGLQAAHASGFESIGPLRIWVRDQPLG